MAAVDLTVFAETLLAPPPILLVLLSPLPEGRIAFSAYQGYIGQIFVLDASGAVVQLTHDVNDNGCPVWSPDGQWIAFDSHSDSRNLIRIISADGSGRSPLAAEIPEGVSPTWSPDGKQVVFLPFNLGEANALNLLKMNLDGTNQTLVSAPWPRVNEGGIRELTWSPDDQWMAFTQDFGSGDEHQITLLNWSTHDFVDIMYATEHPAWSPDGKKLAFTMSSADFTNEDIYVMNVDGTGLSRLTDDPAYDGNPMWSPSGRYIAFISWRTGRDEIYIMNSDGTDQVGVMYSDAGIYCPDWGPGN